MKRKLITAAASTFAAMLLSTAVYAGDIRIVLDGETVKTDTAPVITAEGRTIVPLRVISESLGAKVKWNGSEKQVTAEKAGRKLTLKIGEKTMDNGGETLELDSPAQIINDRTMVPLRVISESFGCEVDWDGSTKTVYITSPKKDVAVLPAFVYSGDDEYLKPVCDMLTVYRKDMFDMSSVAIPTAIIVDTDSSDPEDIKVWGSFSVWNYDLNGTVLELASGGRDIGCIHLKPENGGYRAVSYDFASDGSDYSKSLLKICENNKARFDKVTAASEKEEPQLKAFIEAYVKDKKLNITAYKDSGQDPISLDTGAETAKSGGFDIALPAEFEFSSGAGGWRTVLRLKSDGSFSGSFSDSEMGSTGDGYPNGTVYVCDFNGSFTDIKKNSDGSYSMKLADIKSEKAQDTEWIKDKIKYIASFPYGLEEGTDFVLYLPDTKTDGLSEEFLTWWPGRFDESADKKTLGCYGIYNKATGYGFFGYTE